MKIKILFCLLSFAFSLYSQSYFTPLEFQHAYKNGTRSTDGMPGPNYWQNRSVYKINANIDPQTRTLTGSEEITYYNNSPDSLKRLYIRLYQNRSKTTSPRTWQADGKNFTDGMVISKFTMNGKSYDINSPNFIDNATILIFEPDIPVLAGQTTHLTIEWKFTIPNQPNPRMGAYDSTSYMIAYWYPQMSVYDDIDQWADLQYLGSIEFYNDFSDYDVHLTVPNTFCVWATGVCQNYESVLAPRIKSRLDEAMNSDSVVHVIATSDYMMSRTALFNMNGKTNTWHFKAENVSDFAFASSDHYLWDAVSCEVEKGRRVLIGAAYKQSSWDFPSVAKISYDVIKFFSYEFPAVPYPFPRLTVFNGAGGMEFPMMVNDGTADNMNGTVGVTAHEIAHTYFPFYMGINEHRYAWMDEGMAQFLPEEIQKRLGTESDPRARNTFRYLNFAGTVDDAPMMMKSFELNSSYGNASYFKPCAAYNIMRDFLGKEKFDNTLREYMRRWNGKHPIPYDFFYTFENVLGEDLSWFFKPWFFELGYPDLSVKDVQQSGDKIRITIERIGSLPVPVAMTLNTADSTELLVYRKADVWKDGAKEIVIEEKVNAEITEVKLGTKYIPDVNEKDNVWEK